MKNFNFRRSAMLFGAAAVIFSAGAAETYRDVTGQYMKYSAFIEGWQGALAATGEGVAETWDGAMNLYQVLPDMPAGEYTLTVNAFYRCGNNDFAKANAANTDYQFATIYINGTEAKVEALFNGREVAPNGMGEAAAAFAAGEYLNTVKANHAGGDMVIGIRNRGGFGDEWMCFDNFKLSKDGEDMTSKIVNANFDNGLDAKGAGFWNMKNSANSEKTPDMNKRGGVYRKTNASPYNWGQQVDLPAGTYRFSALTFHRYGGAGNLNGKIVDCKGQWSLKEIKSPKDWFDANAYDAAADYTPAYLYMSTRDEKPTNMVYDSEFGGQLITGKDKITRVKDCWEICNGDYASMPDNETRVGAESLEVIPAYETRNMVMGWDDSGVERESAAAFVNEPEKYRQVVEFTLEAPAKVWLGLAKDENTGDQYWNPVADFKLEKLGDGSNVAEIMNDANAPVEYYNLSGMRIENPSNGIFIVKKGNQVSKQVIR